MRHRNKRNSLILFQDSYGCSTCSRVRRCIDVNQRSALVPRSIVLAVAWLAVIVWRVSWRAPDVSLDVSSWRVSWRVCWCVFMSCRHLTSLEALSCSKPSALPIECDLRQPASKMCSVCWLFLAALYSVAAAFLDAVVILSLWHATEIVRVYTSCT